MSDTLINLHLAAENGRGHQKAYNHLAIITCYSRMSPQICEVEIPTLNRWFCQWFGKRKPSKSVEETL